MREKDRFNWGPISREVDAPNDTLFPKELASKPMAHMTQSELFEFMNALLGMPTDVMKDLASAENKEFMNEACDAWELGNNADPIRPEDLDTFIDETELGEEEE